MNRCVNTVILLGNCGKDPEIRYTPSGKLVAKLSLAINDAFKNGQGQWQERTHWVSVVAWQRLAEIVGEYVQQGTRLYVHGRLNTESWQDSKSSERHYRTSVVAEKLIVLGKGKGDTGMGGKALSQPIGTNSSEEQTSDNRVGSFQDSDVPF